MTGRYFGKVFASVERHDFPFPHQISLLGSSVLGDISLSGRVSRCPYVNSRYFLLAGQHETRSFDSADSICGAPVAKASRMVADIANDANAGFPPYMEQVELCAESTTSKELKQADSAFTAETH